jgi:Amt family ammonium transporter
VTGFFADPAVNGNLNTNLASIVGKTLWLEQIKAIAITLVLAIVGSALIAFIIKAVLGLRPDVNQEEEGLDVVDHGEAGYHDVATGGHVSHSSAMEPEKPRREGVFAPSAGT